jgi:hypothetical protein
MRTMSAAIDIRARPMDVWAVLTDLGSYPQWNPLFREASGEVAVGKTVMLRSVHPAGGRIMTVRATILAAEPGSELRWTSGLTGIIGGEHSFVLTPAGDGTRVVQSESFRGLLVPFCGPVLTRAETSFRALNGALRDRAESRAG